MPLRRLPRAFLLFFSTLTLASCALAATTASDTFLPLSNPGFEQGLVGWNVAENMSPMSRVEAVSAHEGKAGLRITDADPVNGSSVTSIPLTVAPGRHYRLTFWARSLDQSVNCGAYLCFRDNLGKPLAGAATANVSRPGNAEWEQVEITAVAPVGSATVEIWIHSYGTTTGSWDIDDFSLEDRDASAGVAPTASPVASVVPTPAALPPLPDPPTPVILKVDDLVSTGNGGVPERWKRITEFAIERKIKLSIGVIANSLEGDKPAYFAWIKGLQATGLFEFWFHGYDHLTRKENGKTPIEFVGQSYEEQKRRFDLSQKLAIEKLGVPFHTFGPPGGGNVAPSDADLDATVQVMADDPEMKWWLYPKPLDERGARLQSAGKVRILDRVWAVNIENPLFVPNSTKFIEGYARYASGRTFLVAQGHPNQWDNVRWPEFVKLVDFLQQNRIPVITPSELASTAKKP